VSTSPLFWLLALALVGGTLVLLVWPLLRRERAQPPAEDTAATAIFRDHKRQLDDDFVAGTLSAAERDAAMADLVVRFGQELAQPAPPPAPTAERTRYIAALVLVALVPVTAGGLYVLLGDPVATTTTPAPAAAAASDPQIVAMVDSLAGKLKANPEDGEGWSMLARSYRVLGRFEAAALAYGEAAKRLPPSAELLTDWAEAIAQAQGRSLAGEPTQLLNRALALDPTYSKALALSGAAAVERNDLPVAISFWKRLKAQLPAGSADSAQVDAVIAQLENTAKAPPGTAELAPAGTPAAEITGRVDVDPRIASRIAPSDTVFIFARDPSGARMPLAAMKITASELPKAFALTDAMAMSPDARISGAKQVVVEVRVSKSGQVAPQPGDLAGSSTPVAPGANDVRVTIDRVLP
jgi:cytochrome c-type biogenesis protein CcmH